MKKPILIAGILLSAAIPVIAQDAEFLKLTGPYLGQTPPVNEPALFALGILSSGHNPSSATISPGGKIVFYFSPSRGCFA